MTRRKDLDHFTMLLQWAAKGGMMPMYFALTEQQVDYWSDLFIRLEFAEKGIPLDHFIEDPWRYLRQIGVGHLESSVQDTTVGRA